MDKGIVVIVAGHVETLSSMIVKLEQCTEPDILGVISHREEVEVHMIRPCKPIDFTYCPYKKPSHKDKPWYAQFDKKKHKRKNKR